MSLAEQFVVPLTPTSRRLAAVLLAFCLAAAAAGGGAAQEGGESTAAAAPPPSEAAVTDAADAADADASPPAATVESPAEPADASPAAASVEPPLPIDLVIVRAGPEPPPERPPQTISLSLREADLVEVLRSFARLGGFNLVVDPSVKGTVTVELENVRWELALAVILRTHGLAAEIDGTVVSLRPLPGVARR